VDRSYRPNLARVLNNFASRLAELGGRTRGYATRSSSVPATSGRARSRSATLLEQAIRVRATSGSHDWTAPAGSFDRDPPVPHHVLRDDMTLRPTRWIPMPP
jgi:hypothetical protein